MVKYKINSFDGNYTVKECVNLTFIAMVEDLQNKIDDYMDIMVKGYNNFDDNTKELFRNACEKYTKSLFSHLRKRQFME